MPEPVDALVVGGGPAGAAVAIRLARCGHRVALIDRARFPRPKCCAEYSSPATLHELALLDLIDRVDRIGSTSLTGTKVHGTNGARLHGRFAALAGSPFGPVGRALPRREFDALLLAAARDAGVVVHEGHRLEAMRREHDGTMLVDATSGGSVRSFAARIVIGADGLRSRVARLLAPARRGSLRRIAFVTHAHGVAGMTDAAEIHVGRQGYVGLNPVDSRRTNVAVVVPADRAGDARGDPARFFRAELESYSDVAARMAAARLPERVMVSGPFNLRSRRATADGIALVGDAAEYFDPFTGDGILAALAGARLLAAALETPLAHYSPITDRSLATYRRARQQEFRSMRIVERVIGHAMRWPALFDGALRRFDRAGLADTMIGVTGGCVPVDHLISPASLWRLMTANGKRHNSLSIGHRLHG